MSKFLEKVLKEKMMEYIETNFEPEPTFAEFDKKLKEKFKLGGYWESNVDISYYFLCQKEDYNLVCYSLEPPKITFGILQNDSSKIYGFFSAKINLSKI